MAETTGDSVFKVLSGNQLGAEVFLTDGTYSFGSGGEADIQLDDVALQAVHGYVRLRDGKVELRAAQGDLVTASGLSIARGDEVWREIAQMDAVSAGLSKFVIAAQNANWSALGPPAPASTPRKPAGKSLFELVGGLPRRALYGAGSVLAIVLLTGVIGGFGGDAAPRSAAEIDAAALATLRQSVAAMPFADNVTVIERADGTISIEGYVEQQVERRAIQNSLDESGLPATLSVFVRSNLRADVQGTIDSLRLPASFTLDDAGHLTLTGTILDPVAAERLKESIETGIFGLASVESEIRTADAILADLRGIASDAGLADMVIFRLDGLVVEATGIVPRDKMDNWVGLIGVYSRRFANEIPLRSFVTLDQPAEVDTDPIIIGKGPVADAETGRVVAPETLAEPNEVDAQSLFAGQAAPPPSPAPDAASAPAALPQDSSTGNLSLALDRLEQVRPDLHEQLVSSINAGAALDTAVLQEALAAIGGSVQPSAAGQEGGAQIVVEDIGPIGTLDQIARDIRIVLQQQGAELVAPPATSPVAALPAAPQMASVQADLAAVRVEAQDDLLVDATSAAPAPAVPGPVAPAPVVPAAAPVQQTEPDAGQIATLTAVLDRLAERSPALHDRIVTQLEAAQTPDTQVLGEAIAALGGVVPRAGTADQQITIPDLGPVGTMATLATGLALAVQEQPSSVALPAEAPGAQIEEAVVSGATGDLAQGFGLADPEITLAEAVPGGAQEAPEALANPTAAPSPQIAETLFTALDQLAQTRPDLHARLVSDIAEGKPLDPALVQDVVSVLGGSVAAGGSGVEAETPQIVIADLGLAGSIDELTRTITTLLTAPTPSAVAVGNPAEVAASDAVVVEAGMTADAAQETATMQGETEADPPITLPVFALPQGERLTMQPLIDAANSVIEREKSGENPGGGAISPNLLLLAAMQNEQLQFGKTLMRLPEPLTALPYPVDQSVACWEGSSLTPGMLPITLLLLDELSMSNDSDVTGLASGVRDVVMESALSPERVKACLKQTESAFGEMVGGSSTFLSETTRNPDFVEFLFRNVPKSELPLVGANLAGRRYVELADGRKLAEGAAPDITSRIMSIGDLGILLRTAEGTQTQLYGSGLGWRVAETCGPVECEVN